MKLKLPNFGSLCKENILVNGDFNCWQRGETFTIKGDEAFHYTADMWCVYAGTGQTITVKKTTDGLQFRGTSVIMQRMSPLKVGQKYVFLCKVDGDVKTLSITGGTYTENSFLKYNKTGSYEQLQIKSNGTTNVANARLWEGDTVYKIVKEDKATALMRCQSVVVPISNIFNGFTDTTGKFITIQCDKIMSMEGTPVLIGILSLNLRIEGSESRPTAASATVKKETGEIVLTLGSNYSSIAAKTISGRFESKIIVTSEPL